MFLLKKAAASPFWGPLLQSVEDLRKMCPLSSTIFVEENPHTLIYFLKALAGVLSGKRTVLLSSLYPKTYNEKLKVKIHDSPCEGGSVVVWTSGSSGPPKGVEIPLAALISSAESFAHSFGEGDVFNPLPQHHIGGLMATWRPLLSGHKVFFKRPSPIRAPLRASMVPLLAQRCLDQGEGSFLASLEFLLLGGSACSLPLFQQLKSKGIRIVSSYGLTESVAAMAATRDDSPSPNLFHPLFGRTITLIDGRVAFRSAAMAKGFWENGLFKQLPLQNGYFVTEDVARGHTLEAFTLLGRRDLLFQSRGVNCNPLEIENDLTPKISSFVDHLIVVPLSDSRGEMSPCALYKAFRPMDWDRVAKAVSHLPRALRPLTWCPLPCEYAPKVGRHDLRHYAEHSPQRHQIKLS